jgi:hypothetical protein
LQPAFFSPAKKQIGVPIEDIFRHFFAAFAMALTET